MHCNLRLSYATPVPSLKSLNLSIGVLRRFFCRYITFRDYLDLWPWTYAAYRLWRDETLYLIWTQSSNPRRSYYDLNIWPNDLQHRVTCCALLCGNFHRVWPSTTYPCLNYSVFMLIRYVTLWPWSLTRWPGYLRQATRGQSLYKIWTKSSNPRLNYW